MKREWVDDATSITVIMGGIQRVHAEESNPSKSGKESIRVRSVIDGNMQDIVEISDYFLPWPRVVFLSRGKLEARVENIYLSGFIFKS